MSEAKSRFVAGSPPELVLRATTRVAPTFSLTLALSHRGRGIFVSPSLYGELVEPSMGGGRGRVILLQQHQLFGLRKIPNLQLIKVNS